MTQQLPEIEHELILEDINTTFRVFAHRRLSDDELTEFVAGYIARNNVNPNSSYTIMSPLGAPGT